MNSTDDIKYRTIALLDKIEPYYILILVTVGLIGNSISFGIFLSSRLNKKESNIILASLGLVDNFFLITLVLVNLRHVGIDLFNKYSFVCKFTVYFTFICSFLSVWLVTLFSIERFIAVMFPLHRFSICNRKRNQLSIFVLVLFALVFYSFYFVTTGIETDSERTTSQCITYEKWVDMVKAISSVDIILTIVIPFIIILIINISISLKLTRFTLLYRHMRNKSLQRHQQQQFSNWPSPKPSRRSQNRGRRPTRAIPWCTMVTGRSSVSSAAPENEAAPLEETITSTRVTLPPSQPHSPLPVSSTNGALVPPSPKIILLVASSSPLHRQRSEKYSRTTRILLIISLTYILLNTLMAYSKLRHLFDEITHYSSDEDDEHLTAQEKRSKRLNNELLERISCYLYYLNFSINFFLYVLNKSTFRDILIGIFRRNNKSRISKV